MRLRILKHPTGIIDRIALGQFRVGDVCEVGSQLAAVFLKEGWAAIADDDPAKPAVGEPRRGEAKG
jgi:hypothetical protein